MSHTTEYLDACRAAYATYAETMRAAMDAYLVGLRADDEAEDPGLASSRYADAHYSALAAYEGARAAAAQNDAQVDGITTADWCAALGRGLPPGALQRVVSGAPAIVASEPTPAQVAQVAQADAT